MQLEKPVLIQKNPVALSGLSSWQRIGIIGVITAILAGTAGYLLGTNQSVFQNTERASAQPSATITALYSPILTPAPTANWKTYVSSFGYSIKYPTGVELKEGDFFDFQLKNEDLLMTFVPFGIGEADKVRDYIKNGFCVHENDGLREEQLGNIAVYRSEKVYSASNICLDAVIPLRKANWFVDIQGKARNQAAVVLYNEILSTFHFTR